MTSDQTVILSEVVDSRSEAATQSKDPYGLPNSMVIGDPSLRSGYRCLGYSSSMQPIIKGAIPVLPAADAAESLKWWTEVCGFKETFRDATPPNYAGINRGEAYLHIAGMNDKILARKVGDRTMVRLAVKVLRRCMPNIRSVAARCIPTVRCKPSLGEPRNSGRLTLMGCALRFRSESS